MFVDWRPLSITSEWVLGRLEDDAPGAYFYTGRGGYINPIYIVGWRPLPPDPREVGK